jgi:hypothetical protein
MWNSETIIGSAELSCNCVKLPTKVIKVNIAMEMNAARLSLPSTYDSSRLSTRCSSPRRFLILLSPATHTLHFRCPAGGSGGVGWHVRHWWCLRYMPACWFRLFVLSHTDVRANVFGDRRYFLCLAGQPDKSTPILYTQGWSGRLGGSVRAATSRILKQSKTI